MSFWDSRPRLGTFPSEAEKVRVSLVRLSSRTFSLGGVGGVGVTAFGKVVVVGAALLGRKIVLKPVPAKVPVKFERTPSGAVVTTGDLLGTDLISLIWNPVGSEIVGCVIVVSVIA